MKILITGGNSATALKISKAFTNHQVLLADYGDVPNFKSQNYELKSLGSKNEAIAAHHLLSFCLANEVSVILPLFEFEISAIAKAQVLFNEFDIQILLPNQKDIEQYAKSLKSNDWLLFLNGELIFSTLNPIPTAISTQAKDLSGAFYYTAKHNQLGLITIN